MTTDGEGREEIRKWAWAHLNEILNTQWASGGVDFQLGRERALKDLLHFIRELEIKELTTLKLQKD